jgi:chromosome partitioning protein
MNKIHNQRLVGIYEIASLCNVSGQAVINWRKREPDFPKAIAELRMGPVFDKDLVLAWLKEYRKNV